MGIDSEPTARRMLGLALETMHPVFLFGRLATPLVRRLKTRALAPSTDLRAVGFLVVGISTTLWCGTFLGLPDYEPGETGRDAGNVTMDRDAATTEDAATVDSGTAPPDAAGEPAPCQALVARWTGDASANDRLNRSPLRWFPSSSNARYAQGREATVDYDAKPGSEAFWIARPAFLEGAIGFDLSTLDALTIVGWANARPVGNPSGNLVCLGVGANATTAAGGLCLSRLPSKLETRLDSEVATFFLGDPDPWIGPLYRFFAVSIAKTGVRAEIGVSWDGTPRQSFALPAPAKLFATSTPTARLGGALPLSGVDNRFDGRLDDVAVFSRVLTAGEIDSVRLGGIACP